MSIENTQWSDYDNRQTFDFILQQLRPWGYTDESWGNDACPKISLLGDAYHEHDVNLFVGWKDEKMNETHLSGSCQFALNMDNNLQYQLGEDPFRCFYLGDSVQQLIKIAKKVAPAQETYSELLQRGYDVISTGGGCTAWGKLFGDRLVTVTGDSQASLITFTDDEKWVEVDELVTIGVYDQGAPIWGDGTDLDGSANYSWVRVGDRKSLTESLKIAETVAQKGEI